VLPDALSGEITMMRTILLTAIAVGLLTCAATAKAPAPPPSISALLGVWDFTFSGVGIEADAGISEKVKAGGTWTITQEAGNIIKIQSQTEDSSMDLFARYSNGVICISGADDTEPLPQQAVTGVLKATGAAPKLQIRGSIVIYAPVSGDIEVQSGTVQAKKR
jgi:hypothetical protein